MSESHNLVKEENGLVGLPYFQDLPESLIQTISNAAIFRSYIPGKMIISKGFQNQSAYMIIRGNVNVLSTSYDGRSFVLVKLGPGDWFSTISCLNRSNLNPASIQALTPVKCLILPCKRFHTLYKEQPQFAIKVLENIASRLPRITRKLERMALLSVPGRIANFLLEHADDDGIIYWRCTQNDIAIRLGTVAEVVGRNLRQFTDEGLILMPEKHCIIIQDYEGLKEKSFS